MLARIRTHWNCNGTGYVDWLRLPAACAYTAILEYGCNKDRIMYPFTIEAAFVNLMVTEALYWTPM